jgi:hypothetical protein
VRVFGKLKPWAKARQSSPGCGVIRHRFASVEPNISNVVEVLFAGALEGRTLKRKHCLFDDVLVHRYLLERPRSSQCV